MSDIVKILASDDVEKLQEHFQEDFDINYHLPKKHFIVPEIFRNSPPLICMAAFLRAKKCVTYLVTNGCNIFEKDIAGRDVSHFAAAGGSLDIIQFLNLFDIQWTKNDNKCLGPLHFSIIFGRYKALKWFWCSGNADLMKKDGRDLSLLHLAVANGDIEIIKFLCGNGCNVNAKNETGATPLHVAAAKGNIQIVTLLVNVGANPSTVDNAGLYPDQYACRFGFQHIQGYLLDCRDF